MKLYAGLDWLTLIGEDEEGKSEQMYQAVSWMEKLEIEHGRWRDWKFQGFKGQTCGPVSAGFNLDNFIICVSGAAAEGIEDELPSLSKFRATRVDYQVTVMLEEPVATLAGDAFYKLQKLNDTRKQKRVLIYYSGDNDTLYVNRRSSPVVLRLYDRTGRMGDQWQGQKNLFWRYEVEYKRDYASEAFKSWLGAPNRTEHIRDTVKGEFEKRDIVCGFGSDSATSMVVHSGKTTVDSNLSWLHRTVRPVCARLINSGYESEALKALGFSLDEEQGH